MHDFREFIFTATGKDTDIGRLDLIDLKDNLVAEVERLGALGDLLTCVRQEDLGPDSLSGIGLLLGDVRARMSAILDLGLANSNPKSRKKAQT